MERFHRSVRAASLICCLLSGTAYAAETTLTVRKRAEPYQAVPSVVYNFQKEDVSARNLDNPLNISRQTPGFAFTDPFGRFNPAPALRGVVQQGLGDEPPVASFVDGYYISGRSSINAANFDTENITIVKGPQNALYGRNSFAGALIIESVKPAFENSASLETKISSVDRNETTAIANVKASDRTAVRMAVYRRDWGGLYNNRAGDGPEIGEEKTQAGRLSVLFKPNDRREILWRMEGIFDDDGQPKGFLAQANCGPRTSDGQNRLYCGEVPESGPQASNDLHTGYDRQHVRTSLNWQEALSPNWTSFLMAGASREDSEFNRDDDYSPSIAARAGQRTDRYDIQLDGRLNYDAGADWAGLIGASYYLFDNYEERRDQLYVLGQPDDGGAINDGETRTYSLYGSVIRRLPYAWELTLDGRAQYEEKTLNSSILDAAGDPLDLRDDWAAFTPKATLSKTGMNGTLFYGSVARGYKAGGFNTRANIFSSERAYDPEENLTYELGFKNAPLRVQGLTLDAGLFYIDWTDQQVVAYSTAGTTQNFFLNNAAETVSQGLEAALHWTPSDRLNVDLGYTLTDARFKNYNDPSLSNVQGFTPDGDVSGNRLPRYSKHHFVGAVKWQDQVPFAADWIYNAGMQGVYQSRQYTDNANTSYVGDRFRANAQLNVEKDNVLIGLFADNIFDDDTPEVGIPWYDATQGFQRAYLVVPTNGRVVGLRAKITF